MCLGGRARVTQRDNRFLFPKFFKLHRCPEGRFLTLYGCVQNMSNDTPDCSVTNLFPAISLAKFQNAHFLMCPPPKITPAFNLFFFLIRDKCHRCIILNCAFVCCVVLFYGLTQKTSRRRIALFHPHHT